MNTAENMVEEGEIAWIAAIFITFAAFILIKVLAKPSRSDDKPPSSFEIGEDNAPPSYEEAAKQTPQDYQINDFGQVEEIQRPKPSVKIAISCNDKRKKSVGRRLR